MSPRRDLLPNWRILLATLREHWIGTLSWVVGGAAAMLFMGLALDQEMAGFPGGAQALAVSVAPAAEAMRILRWPAEHLETLGGYLTFHNIMLFSGFLALYAALQGARLVRAPEERHALEQVLATGWSRSAYLRDRMLAFTVVLALICAGLAMGTAWALAVADAPDLSGSIITWLSVGLGALMAGSLGLLVSQFTRTARTAGGIAALVLVAMYLANNAIDVDDPGGTTLLDWLPLLTPFYWVNQSRALVPGHGLDPGAMAVLIGVALLLSALAAVAFTRRDYGAALWARSHQAPPWHTASRDVQQWWLRTTWVASLKEHRIGLLAWAAGSAGFAGLMIALQPAAMDVFKQFSYYLEMAGGSGTTPEVMYLTFATDVTAPIVAAYVITQSAGWVADLQQGRVETLLAAPVSWTRLILERLLATAVGLVVIILATLGTMIVGSYLIEAEVSFTGFSRVAAICLLLGWAVAALAMLGVVALRHMVAVTLLATYLATAYLLTWMIPMFGWPTWTERLSIFVAFGHPYREWPGSSNLALLTGIALVGTVASMLIADRTAKVA